MAVAATGGTQSAALLVSRCRLGSGDECLCKVLAEESKELCEEQYRVATLTTSNETATETMTTAQFLRHRFSRLVSRSIFQGYRITVFVPYKTRRPQTSGQRNHGNFNCTQILR